MRFFQLTWKNSFSGFFVRIFFLSILSSLGEGTRFATLKDQFVTAKFVGPKPFPQIFTDLAESSQSGDKR